MKNAIDQLIGKHSFKFKNVGVPIKTMVGKIGNDNLMLERPSGSNIDTSDFVFCNNVSSTSGTITIFDNTDAREINTTSILINDGITINTIGNIEADYLLPQTSGHTIQIGETGELELNDGVDLILGTTTGTKIGTSTSQKLSFYNSTPIIKPGAYTQTYSTTDKTHANLVSTAVSTTGATNVTPYGYTTSAQANDIVTQINNLRTDLTDVKQLCNSIIDDLQALGLVA